MADPKLIDFGERRLLSEIIPRYSKSSGDDCESFSTDRGQVVFTTDPVPPPAAQSIGGDSDPYWAGWLLVTINASDIAASGAEPKGFLVAAEFPPDETVVRFERFLVGVREACESEGFTYSGGNLREAAKFGATGTAIGWRRESDHLGRRGGQVGDLVVAVGAGGLFWRDALRLKAGGEVDKHISRIFRPTSQGKAMRVLSRSGLVQAAMDSSDGLVPTLFEIARVNSANIVVEADKLVVPDVENLTPDPRKLWLGWGDWIVVGVIRAADLPQASAAVAGVGSSVHVLGRLEAGEGRVFFASGGKTLPAGRLESERFATDSWFGRGIDGYLEDLLAFELP